MNSFYMREYNMISYLSSTAQIGYMPRSRYNQRVIENSSFYINPLAARTYNCDFDGDVM